MSYIAGSNNMKKILILLSILIFTNSCITVVFEPYMGDDQKGKIEDSHHEAAKSESDEHLN